MKFAALFKPFGYIYVQFNIYRVAVAFAQGPGMQIHPCVSKGCRHQAPVQLCRDDATLEVAVLVEEVYSQML